MKSPPGLRFSFLAMLFVVGCATAVSVMEYPDYLKAREKRRNAPEPAPLIDPFPRPVTQP